MTRKKYAASTILGVLLAACGSPVEPTSSGAVGRLAEALRQQGLTVTVGGQIAPGVNGFFSVPAHQLRVNQSQVQAFLYPTSEAAAAEAALISPDGQPGPTVRVSWISTPRFYRQNAVIVLYVGCDAEIVRALQNTVGTPIAVGPTPCT
jgi:hypothetical protein